MLRVADWRNRPAIVLSVAVCAAAAIAVLDVRLPYGVPLSFLYLVPMAMIGSVASRWQVLTAAAICTGVAEYSDAFTWNAAEGIPRDLLSFMAFAAEGLYIREALAKRRVEQSHIRTLQHENQARREAEEQLSLLIGSSALAILTLDKEGLIVQANQAARHMFGGPSENEALLGVNVSTFLPALGRVPHRAHPERPMRTVMQAQGFRHDSVPFLAEVWFSTYSTSHGPRTAAMVIDASDDFRDREESALEQLLNSSRLAVGAVAHEIRNVSSAIQLVQRNLQSAVPELTRAPDFAALQQLTSTLERMATVETAQAKRTVTTLPLQHCFEELQIVSQAMLREHDIALEWNMTGDLPQVWADQHGLMQVFLNILRNAQEALAPVQSPCIRVEAHHRENTFQIRVSDNGPGVADPGQLFRPFWATGRNTSFGLYLSRAILSSFQAELSYEALHPGACFVISLQVARL